MPSAASVMAVPARENVRVAVPAAVSAVVEKSRSSSRRSVASTTRGGDTVRSSKARTPPATVNRSIV
jgi:hypothetical protein